MLPSGAWHSGSSTAISSLETTSNVRFRSTRQLLQEYPSRRRRIHRFEPGRLVGIRRQQEMPFTSQVKMDRARYQKMAFERSMIEDRHDCQLHVRGERGRNESDLTVATGVCGQCREKDRVQIVSFWHGVFRQQIKSYLWELACCWSHQPTQSCQEKRVAPCLHTCSS